MALSRGSQSQSKPKMHSYRQQNEARHHRMIAQNFLANISLNGTHDDTALRIFKHKGLGLPGLNSHCSAKQSDAGFGAEAVEISSAARQDRKKSSRSSDNEEGSNTDKKQTQHRTKRRPSFRERLSSSSSAEGGGGSSGLRILQKLGNILNPQTNELQQLATLSPVPSESSMSVNRAPPQKQHLQPALSVSRFRGGIKSENVCFVSNQTQAPLLVCSVIPFQQKDLAAVRRRNSSAEAHFGLRPIEFSELKSEISYAALLLPTIHITPMKKPYLAYEAECLSSSLGNSSVTAAQIRQCYSQDVPPNSPVKFDTSFDFDVRRESLSDSKIVTYDPDGLSNPEFNAGKHKTTLAFGSYIVSITDYASPADAKKQMNQKFADKFPGIRLTYSKFNSLKREMRDVARKSRVDFLILAQAFVYFEKIILKALINKLNRKPIAGVCLVIAAKLSDVKGQQMTELIGEIETKFRLNRRELLAFELPVAVALDFSLIVQDFEIVPHYQRLLSFL